MGYFPQILSQEGETVTWKKRQEGAADPEIGDLAITWTTEDIKALVQHACMSCAAQTNKSLFILEKHGAQKMRANGTKGLLRSRIQHGHFSPRTKVVGTHTLRNDDRSFLRKFYF